MSIGLLMEIPVDIIRDNDYARLLTAIPEPPDLTSNSWFGMADPTIQYASYYCKDIFPFVEDLSALQHFHHSETSILSIDPSLVSALRDMYYRERSGATDVKAYVQSGGTDFLDALRREHSKLKAALLSINTTTKNDCKAPPPQTAAFPNFSADDRNIALGYLARLLSVLPNLASVLEKAPYTCLSE